MTDTKTVQKLTDAQWAALTNPGMAADRVLTRLKTMGLIDITYRIPEHGNLARRTITPTAAGTRLLDDLAASARTGKRLSRAKQLAAIRHDPLHHLYDGATDDRILAITKAHTSLPDPDLTRLAHDPDDRIRAAIAAIIPDDRLHLFDMETDPDVIRELHRRHAGWLDRHTDRLMRLQDPTVMGILVCSANLTAGQLHAIILTHLADDIIVNMRIERPHYRDREHWSLLTREDMMLIADHDADAGRIALLDNRWKTIDGILVSTLIDDRMLDHWAETCGPQLAEKLSLNDHWMTDRRADIILNRHVNDTAIVAHWEEKISDRQADLILQHHDPKAVDRLGRLNRPWNRHQIELLTAGSAAFRERLTQWENLTRNLFADPETAHTIIDRTDWNTGENNL